LEEKKTMKLSPLIHRFFDQYLLHIKGVSYHTTQAYRDTFKLFLPFAACFYRIKIRSLRVEHLSSELIIAFLEDLQHQRKNRIKTRNQRLAALKSFAKMIRFMYPEQQQVADIILNIPQKRSQKPLIGFLYQDEILSIFHAVDLKRKQGLRDYALLHLLYDSGARASELSTLNLDYFDPQKKTLAILGKGNRFRLIKLKPKTAHLLQLYIRKYRIPPHHPYQDRLFINQRGGELTRHGIYRICRKYLQKTLPPKRLKYINPVHSFRHSRAIDMLYSGSPITDIKNHLGHDNIQSTTIYLQLDLNRRRHIQRQFIRHMESVLTDDPNIEDLLKWENEGDLMAWLDSL
jgi:site-specific recombinase XerD